jgi:hypothetical protein
MVVVTPQELNRMQKPPRTCSQASRPPSGNAGGHGVRVGEFSRLDVEESPLGRCGLEGSESRPARGG